MTTLPQLVKRRVTLYYSGGFFGNINKIEAMAYAVRVGSYAQYSSAVHIWFVPKGGRKVRGMVQTSGTNLLILEGWGHPDAAPMMGETTETVAGAIVSRSRFSAFDPRWETEFGAMIGAHVSGTGSQIVHDFRNWNPYTPFIGPAEATPRERYEAQQAAAAAAEEEARATGADVAEAMATASEALYGGSHSRAHW